MFCIYNILGPPSISYYSSDIVALEGDKVTFMCNATNDEHSAGPIQISWYTGTHPFKPDGKRILIHNKYDNDTNQLCSVLLLDPVSHTDSGEYVCRAFTSLFCYTENRINLTVECKLIMHCILCVIYICMYTLFTVLRSSCNIATYIVFM